MLDAEREAASQCCQLLLESSGKVRSIIQSHNVSFLNVAIYMQLTELLSLESICRRWAHLMHVWMILRLLM